MPKAKSTIQIKNRRASFDYEFLETYTAGIQLVGTEIKSIRAGKASLQDAYCYFVGNQLFVRGMNIAQYHWGSWGQHEPVRDRRLLLTRKELNHLLMEDKKTGLTIVAVKLFIADNGYAKLLIALAKGKKEYDKRNTIKERDVRREMDRGIQKIVVPLPSQKQKWRDLDCLQPLKKMLNYISYQCFVFLASAFCTGLIFFEISRLRSK